MTAVLMAYCMIVYSVAINSIEGLIIVILYVITYWCIAKTL